ncbi:MAG: DUF1552 domain-containing protein [Myxococcota bacterium]
MSWRGYAQRSITRRSLLRGLGAGAGSLFLSPTIRRLKADGAGQAPRQRLVIVTQGNGSAGFSRWDRLTDATPRITTFSDMATDFPMAPSWNPWRQKVAAFNGLAGKYGAGGGAGHRSNYYALINRPYAGSSSPAGPSIDAYLAQELGGGQVFDAIRLGGEGPGRGLVNINSAQAAFTPLTHQCDPAEAWRELFGVAAEDPDDRAAFEERGALLSSISNQIRRAERELLGDERWKFQRYLYAVETFEQRQGRLLARQARLAQCAPTMASTTDQDDVGTTFEKMTALAGAALLCGLTEIVVMSVATADQFGQFAAWGFGGGHTIGHGRGATATRPGGQEAQVQIQAEVTQRLTDNILVPLSGVPEGNGTMLDNTTVVYLNDNAEHHHSKYDSWPAYMVGDFGGRLRPGGRLIEYPNRRQSNSRGLNQLWNTVCYGMGIPKDDWAMDANMPDNGMGPLDELMT